MSTILHLSRRLIYVFDCRPLSPFIKEEEISRSVMETRSSHTRRSYVTPLYPRWTIFPSHLCNFLVFSIFNWTVPERGHYMRNQTKKKKKFDKFLIFYLVTISFGAFSYYIELLNNIPLMTTVVVRPVVSLDTAGVVFGEAPGTRSVPRRRWFLVTGRKSLYRRNVKKHRKVGSQVSVCTVKSELSNFKDSGTLRRRRNRERKRIPNRQIFLGLVH